MFASGGGGENIPHADKHLAVWLAEPIYLTLSGTNVLAWTDTITSRVMNTTSTAKPQWNGNDVFVNTEAMELVFATRVLNCARVFVKCTPVSAQSLDTRLWFGSTNSLRRHVSDVYRSQDSAQNSEDYPFSTGRVWINGVRTSSFSGEHVVSAETPSPASWSFWGLKSHFDTRHPRARYEAIIITSSVTDSEGDDITDWLLAYKP